MKYEWNEVIDRIVISKSQPKIEVREPKHGLRHNKEVLYVHHRFPVKDGIDEAEYMYRLMSQPNPILEWVKKMEHPNP